jgi:pheromone a factor receptor
MLVCILPLQGFVLYYDITLALPWHPYSWAQMHNSAWSEIIKVPVGNTVFFDRWTPVASGFMIFIFFGFGRDATRMYRTIFWYLGLGYCFPSIKPPSSTQNSVPSPRAGSGTTLVGTLGSRAKSLFSRGTGTFVARASTDNDIEKGGSDSIFRRDGRSDSPRWTWLSALFGRRRTVNDTGTLLEDFEAKTVHTNAWSSQRGSGDYSIGPASPMRTKDFIHVRQVISQQSEVHIEV